MSVCTYDNPNTMRRECWQNGKNICSYSMQFILTCEHDRNAARNLFFGANIGPWKTGQLNGDKAAMDEN